MNQVEMGVFSMKNGDMITGAFLGQGPDITLNERIRVPGLGRSNPPRQVRTILMENESGVPVPAARVRRDAARDRGCLAWARSPRRGRQVLRGRVGSWQAHATPARGDSRRAGVVMRRVVPGSEVARWQIRPSIPCSRN